MSLPGLAERSDSALMKVSARLWSEGLAGQKTFMQDCDFFQQ